MSTEKTGIGKLIAKLGDIFSVLFNAAKRAYLKEAPAVQAAMKDGSAILEIINSNVALPSSSILSLIKAAFPSLEEDKLKSGLIEVSKALNLAEGLMDDTLEETINNLQLYLQTLNGGIWAGISSLAAKILAFVFAPEGTKWATIESLMEFVYHTYVKKG